MRIINTVLFSLFFVLPNEMQAQRFTLSAKEIEATLFIEPFTDIDSVIVANIVIENISDEKIYIPVERRANIASSLDLHFFYRANRLYYLAGCTEYFFGPLDLGSWVEVEELSSKATKTITITIPAKDLTNYKAIKDIKKSDIQGVVFRIDYLTSKKAKKIIRHFDNKMVIKSKDYVGKCVNLRLSIHCTNAVHLPP